MLSGPQYAIQALREHIFKFQTYQQQLKSQRSSGGSVQEVQTLKTYVKYRNNLDDGIFQCSLMRILEIGAFARNLNEIVEITSDVQELYQMCGLGRSEVDAPELGRARAVLVDSGDETEDNLKRIRASLGV
jgi:hypothetical protein